MPIKRYISTSNSTSTVADLFNEEMAATFGSAPSTYDGNDNSSSSSAFSLPRRSRVQVTEDEATSTGNLKKMVSSESSSESRVVSGEIHVHIHLPLGHTKASSPNVVVHIHVMKE